MEKSKRLEIKVGLFVAVGLLLLAILLLQFSKSTSIFQGNYELRLHAVNVGGIKPRAQVLLAGVQVGVVSDIKLAPDGRSVTIFLKIYKNFQIYGDARFSIEQAGILGDQYIAITPTANAAPFLADGTDVPCAEPFDLQEVARSASGFIQQLDTTAKKLDAAITDFKRVVLNEETLTNFAQSIANAHTVSEEAMTTVADLNHLVATNQAQVNLAISNVVAFSQKLDRLGDSADALLASNGVQIAVATHNLAESSETLKNVMNDVKNGKGLAGTILQNQTLATNVQAIASNLAVTTSNLNRVGLWGILWAPKHSGTNDDGSGHPNHVSK
jgi:phospholipid/cholesterol/gamma-HCH transport system substrate-binding protein